MRQRAKRKMRRWCGVESAPYLCAEASLAQNSEPLDRTTLSFYHCGGRDIGDTKYRLFRFCIKTQRSNHISKETELHCHDL
jgi:hypothetical protein